jgi:hypothetical protein
VSARDFAEFIRILNSHKVRYLVIGGYAVAFHGHPRATDDIDVLIERTEANVRRVEAALIDFIGDKPEPGRLRRPGGMIRMGGSITHIDVTTKIDGLRDFGRLWRRRVRGEILGERSQYISLADLLRTKRAANRTKDRADIEALTRVLRVRDPAPSGSASAATAERGAHRSARPERGQRQRRRPPDDDA